MGFLKAILWEISPYVCKPKDELNAQDDVSGWFKGKDLVNLPTVTHKGSRLNGCFSIVFWLSERAQHSVGPLDVRGRKD